MANRKKSTLTDQEVLLNRVRICDFILHEAALFLDTHPDNADAMAYYQKYLAVRKAANQAYVEKYGPLVVSESATSGHWNWIDGPWPWENPDCEV